MKDSAIESLNKALSSKQQALEDDDLGVITEIKGEGFTANVRAAKTLANVLRCDLTDAAEIIEKMLDRGWYALPVDFIDQQGLREAFESQMYQGW